MRMMSVITKKKVLPLLLKILISLSLLAYLIYLSETEQLLEKLKMLSVGFILTAWIYYALCQLLSAYRWQLFLSAKEIHVPLHRLFGFYMVGMFLNNFIPGAVGGDVVKAYDLYRSTRQAELAVTSVFLERFTGLIGLGIIAIAAVFIGFQSVRSPLIWICVAASTIFLVAVIACLWHDRLSRWCVGLLTRFMPTRLVEKVEKLHQALHSYKYHRKTLAVTILLSVILQLLFAFYYALTATALNIEIDVYYFILFLPIVTLVTMLPLSLGGLGIREAALVVLFAEVGISSAEVLAVSLTVHVVNTGLSLLGGIILLVRKPVAAS
jgi:uncharacterized protein (TIRG00374 family)